MEFQPSNFWLLFEGLRSVVGSTLAFGGVLCGRLSEQAAQLMV